VYTGDKEPFFDAEFAVFDQELNDNPHLACVDSPRATGVETPVVV
jgi:hypothetical protein